MIEFVIYKDHAGKWRWQLEAGNNGIIADSGEGYSERESAEKAIKIVQKSSTANVRVAADPDPYSDH